MNNVNIFENENAQPLMGEFFPFGKIGDAIQGTYVDRRKGTDTFGNAQTIYVLIDNQDKVWNCGFRESSVTGQIIADRMENAEYGVIVGFRFDAEKPSKVKPGVMAKVVNVYFDPKVVDADWVTRRSKVETITQEQADEKFKKEVSFTAPEDAGAAGGNLPTSEAKPRNEAIDAIRQLAKTKGLTTDAMTEAEADAVIEKYTGFSLDVEHLTKIIISLTGYVSK